MQFAFDIQTILQGKKKLFACAVLFARWLSSLCTLITGHWSAEIDDNDDVDDNDNDGAVSLTFRDQLNLK